MEDSTFMSFVVSWRERNDRSFENRERTQEEIKYFFFKTLYLWTTAFVFSLVISYHDFLIMFSSSSLVFFLIYFLYIWKRLTFLIIL
jgi:hypothetical protein